METAVTSRTYASYVSSYLNQCRLWLTWSWFFRQCRVVTFLIVAGSVSYLLGSHFLFGIVRVEGPSMYPTLTDSGCYWLNRFAYVVSDPKRDDIVALKDPQDDTPLVKRIIATPGQSIYIKSGRVYVNGQLLDEPYLAAKTPTYAYEKSEDEFICIGNDDYFVLGDNRKNSTDSRSFGAVPRKNILGKVME